MPGGRWGAPPPGPHGTGPARKASTDPARRLTNTAMVLTIMGVVGYLYGLAVEGGRLPALAMMLCTAAAVCAVWAGILLARAHAARPRLPRLIATLLFSWFLTLIGLVQLAVTAFDEADSASAVGEAVGRVLGDLLLGGALAGILIMAIGRQPRRVM